MQEEEKVVGERDPEPGYLNEEDVEEVLFLGEVAGRFGGGVGLRDGVVGGVAGGGVEEGEEGADDEGCGVDCQQEGFERCGEEGGRGAGGVECRVGAAIILRREACCWFGGSAVAASGR